MIPNMAGGKLIFIQSPQLHGDGMTITNIEDARLI
jgi:hypothetical protein